MTPFTASTPPSPSGDASVVITTLGPLCHDPHRFLQGHVQEGHKPCSSLFQALHWEKPSLLLLPFLLTFFFLLMEHCIQYSNCPTSPRQDSCCPGHASCHRSQLLHGRIARLLPFSQHFQGVLQEVGGQPQNFTPTHCTTAPLLPFLYDTLSPNAAMVYKTKLSAASLAFNDPCR